MRKSTKKFYPLRRLAIEITNVCNADCSFCAYRYMKRKKELLSNKDFEFFLKRYVEYGGGELKLTPIVGDPLIDKNLIAKIKMAKATKKITHLYAYTNLIGLDNFNIREFLQSGIDKIDISLCIGSKEMYRRLFGVNCYERVIENLAKLLYCNKLLGNKVKVDIILRCDKPYDDIFASKTYKKIIALGGKIRVVENYDNWTGLIKQEDLPKGQQFRKIGKMKEPCSLFYKGVMILMNGDVTACWCRDLQGTLIIGNIYKNSLKEIWEGKELKALRDNWYKGKIPKICKKCYQYTPLSDFLKEIKPK